MSSIKRLMTLWAGQELWLGLGALSSLISLASAVLLMTLAGWFVSGAEGASQVAGLTLFGVVAPRLAMRLLVFVRTAARYTERLVTHEATFRILAKLRVWFMARAIPLSPAKLSSYRSGDLLNRIMADIDALDHFYLRMLVPIFVATVASICITIFIASQSILLAIISTTAFCLAGLVLPLWIKAKANAPGRQLIQAQSELRSLVIDQNQGVAELQIYQSEDNAKSSFHKLQSKLQTVVSRLEALAGLSTAGSQVISSLLLLAMVVGGAWLLQEKATTVSQLAIILFVVFAALEILAPLPAAFLFLGKTEAAAERLFEILDQDDNPDFTGKIATSLLPIEFNDVSLSYGNGGQTAVSELNLSIAEGSWTTILGPSGGGKSSILNLLLGFWKPTLGTLKFNTVDGRTLAAETVLKHVAYLSQRPHIFSGTVRENLLLADPKATDVELWSALEKADLKRYFESRPDDLETWLGEFGTGLSGGQQRRLALAQVFLKNSPVILLDEPTENLDLATERSIFETLFTFAKGKTLVLVTHRAIDLSRMDQVIMIDEGKVVDQGNPDELLKRHKGLIAQDSQSAVTNR